VTAAPAHDKLSAYTTCGTCHTLGQGAFADIYSLHKNDCMKCHGSTDTTVQATITAGKNGTAVNCTNCHGSSHHGSPQAKAGNCTFCHADPRSTWTTMKPGDNGSTNPYPTQLACAKCHVRVSGTAILIDKIVNNGNYSTAPTRTVQHTLDGTTATINNYGICFSCHNGTKAKLVSPFHAMPSSAPSRNRCSSMKTAPGRGSFNLKSSSWHGREKSSWGSESCKSDSGRFDSPSVNFKMIAIPCASYNGCSSANTIQVPVLPAVGM
jgi:hypothetical protein